MVFHREKIVSKRKKRVGRGYGSGKGGHTAGRGTKGQKSRGKIPLLFEAGARGSGFYKRLPLFRGKGKLKSNQKKPLGVNVKYLNILKKNTKVTVQTLIRANIVDKVAEKFGVKILGDGDISIPLTVAVPVTKGAKAKIEKAGGVVVSLSEKKESAKETKKPNVRKSNKSK